MDDERFGTVCREVIEESHEKKGIGTLNEKTLHAVLKNYIEPDRSRQEVPLLGYVADIFDGERITEIQTRNFYGMKKKLAVFLDAYPVTVVYPVPRNKYICWIDPATGEISDRRKSPKKPHLQEMAHELIHILPHLEHPNLTFRIMYVDVCDYRLKNGWDETGKRGSERQERIPEGYAGDIYISCIDDYRIFIPEDLPEEFTLKEYRKCAGVTEKCARRMIYILMKLDLLTRPRKEGRAYIYRRG